jgi:hypothetical protein
MQERVRGEEIIKHNFILFFTKVEVKKLELKESKYGTLKWVNLKEIRKKEKIIPSDLWLIKNKLNSRINLKEITISEKEGRLVKSSIK